jgi:acyl-[acyl-carrier-protein]-phospholipid O-acyltransferase/long-chain-fatty-acid--[acyl-carrier-protein] ligase
VADCQPASVLVPWATLFPEEAYALPGLIVPLAALLLLCWLWPYGLLRLALWLLTHSLYWLRVEGRRHVPAHGPALLVCNPVNCLAWLLVLAAHRRFIRLVVAGGWTRRWGLRHLLRWAGAIRVDGSGGQAGLERALREAGEALARGELVCLFAEGWRTPDGFELPFHRAFEQVAARQAAPVVPVCLIQPWGGLLCVSEGRLVRKWPQELPSPAEVTFGAPLPRGTPAAEARQAQQLLSAAAALDRTPRRRPLHRQFVRMAAHVPFRPCFIDSSAPGRDLTYAKAYVGTVCLARLLRPLLGDVSMVGVWLPPSTGAALANIALAVLGKTSVNLNYTAGPEATRSALQQCGCRHVLTARRFTARLPIDPGPGIELVYLDDLLPKVTRWQKLRALLAVALLPGWFLDRVVLRLGRHTVDGLATVIFSSGSTGEPKGVMLSHANVAANLESMVQATSLRPTDRALGVLPFFHSFGYTVALWAPLQVGASAVYHADPRQAKEIGELCRTHRCTVYLSTATFLRFCLKKCGPDDFRTLRILMCGAEKLPPALAADFQARFGVLPLEGYGCTELSPAAAANMPDQEFDGLTEAHNRTGTVGPPLPGCAARVVHPETRAPLPVGEEGLLLISGANVMRGYLNRPELTAQAVLDGWYVTGDMARLDADGFVTLTGRLSRFAKVGGEMVPLEKIEEELHDILGTGERVCAVTCVPCESRGERLVVLYVAVQLSQHGLEVRPWLQGLSKRGLPNLWVPSERDFFDVPELPLLGSGKVNLKGVKEMALALAGRR